MTSGRMMPGSRFRNRFMRLQVMRASGFPWIQIVGDPSRLRAAHTVLVEAVQAL